MAPATAGSTAETMRAALDVLRTPSQADETPSKSALTDAAGAVRAEATKVGVMFMGGGAPSEAEAAALCAALQQAAIRFCVVAHGFTAGAGPTLHATVQTAAGRVVDPCTQLAAALQHGQPADVKQQVGKVWQACDGMARVPLDNKAAIFRRLADVYGVLKDVLRELAELTGSRETGQDGGEEEGDAAAAAEAGTAAAGAAASNGGGAAAGAARAFDPDPHFEPDLDLDTGDLSSWEAAAVEGARKLVDAAAAGLKAASKALLQGSALAPDEALDGWESALFHARHLQRAAEDLGAGLYPPQDAGEVGSAAHALHTAAEVLLDECPALDQLGAAADAAQARMWAGLEGVQAALREGQAQEAGAGGISGADSRGEA